MHLASISDLLRDAAERSDSARAEGATERELSLDLEELLTNTIAEAAARTGAKAVAIRVEGPGGAPVTAILGAEHGVDWTDTASFSIAADSEAAVRLAVPILEGGVETGVIVAHARAGQRFLAGHERALVALAEETAAAVASARRFTGAARRVEIDVATGVHNQRGYEVALEREVARAVRSQRPLAVVLLALQDLADEGEADRRAHELAALLERLTRNTDTVFRRSREELGVLLPHTSSEGAQRFHGRLRAELEASTFTESDALTVSTGISEWRPHETSHSFDARARAALVDSGIRALPRRPDSGEAAGEDTLDARRPNHPPLT